MKQGFLIFTLVSIALVGALISVLIQDGCTSTAYNSLDGTAKITYTNCNNLDKGIALAFLLPVLTVFTLFAIFQSPLVKAPQNNTT